MMSAPLDVAQGPRLSFDGDERAWFYRVERQKSVESFYRMQAAGVNANCRRRVMRQNVQDRLARNLLWRHRICRWI